MNNKKFVSVHGGHSGEFCNHAQDRLEDIVIKYIESNFKWVGITEHIYPISNELRYPDQINAELDISFLAKKFKEYIKVCRELQQKYRDKIKIYTAFETETYNGYKEFIPYLINKFKPDYVVGSIHHVAVYNIYTKKIEDICIDYSEDYYKRAVNLLEQNDILSEDQTLNGIERLYCSYFDAQYEMITAIKPYVVGHFDLIRIFDKDYCDTIKHPLIWGRITRNLELIKKKNLIMDFNLRSLMKGASEPYISEPILAESKKMGINVVIGDDSHGIKDIGVNIEKGIDILKQAGFKVEWENL